MRKAILLLTVVGMVLGASVAQAQDEELGVTFDNEFTTKYIWHGYDLFDDHGAWMPSLDFDLFGSGFSVNVWMAQPIGSGNEEAKELDYTVAYGNTVYEGETYEMEYSANYIYYDFYEANKKADNQEVGVSVAFPKVLEGCVSGLVPSYYIGKIWYNEGTSHGGGFHVLALDYGMEVPECPMTESMNFHGDLNFNDGYAGSDADWSHITLGVSSDVEVAGVAFTPYINFQISMDDSVNKEDELWAGVSTSISF